MFFKVSQPIEIIDDCPCESVLHGNLPRVKSSYSIGLTAAMQGWSAICRVKDYDDLADEWREEE